MDRKVRLSVKRPSRNSLRKFSPNGNHHRVAAKVVSKIDRGRPATSVHGFVLDVFRARAQRSGARARARSIDRAIVSFHPVQRAAPAGI